MKTPEELKTYRKDPDVGPWCVSNGEMNNPYRMVEIKANAKEVRKPSLFARISNWMQSAQSRKKKSN